MYKESIENAGDLSIKKNDFAKNNLGGYFVASMLAGIYVGFGILLIFAVGAPFASANSFALKLVMGLSFGVALTLVVFAGSELFTGNVMYMCFGLFQKKINLMAFLKVLVICWIGNLAGSLLLAFMAVYGNSLSHAMDFFTKVSLMKIKTPPVELFLRAVLCNMLVCLALWTSSRTSSDAAKIMLIFWCLFAFIGSGFEHSVANMTLIAVGIIGSSGVEALGWGGFFYNILWVTLGNFVGGALFIAGSYQITQYSKNK
ncbi:MAG: formate/nitrite transporter family protein [Spirochaetales bacterium]|nr:formate/nitrite transporter family protein [Spirochaetales bacterium]